MSPKNLVLVLDNVRSAHNVGAIFRSADAFGVERISCTGITPYPRIGAETRLPHVATKAHQMIAKTALGAELTVPFDHVDTTEEAIGVLRLSEHKIYALEQAHNSVPLTTFSADYPCGLIVGNEVDGISEYILQLCDAVLEIPMVGTKESLNVGAAAGIALYALSV